jgi:hypothetical protein
LHPYFPSHGQWGVHGWLLPIGRFYPGKLCLWKNFHGEKVPMGRTCRLRMRVGVRFATTHSICARVKFKSVWTYSMENDLFTTPVTVLGH